MSETTQSGAATVGGASITLAVEPGVLFESTLGAGVLFTETIHAVGMTQILEQVFNPNNTSNQYWTTLPLDANGNATVTVRFTAGNQYLNVASPDTTINVVTYPAIIADTVAATAPGQVLTLSGNMLADVTVPATINQSGGADTINASAAGLTVNATGGSDTIYASAGAAVINEAPVSEYVQGLQAALSTINGAAGGADTIFAGDGVLYNGQLSANSLFVGGPGASTVISASHQTAFGGASGGTYTIGDGSFILVTAGGGTDTVYETATSAAGLIWANSGENMTVATVPGTASATGATLIAFGNNDTINAQNAAGGNTFMIINQALNTPAGTFAGNTTLVGSNAGHDGFNIFVDGSAPAPHTITIENWQPTDYIFMNNLGESDDKPSAADLATINGFLAGSSQSFTLGDGTTVNFVGARGTTIVHV